MNIHPHLVSPTRFTGFADGGKQMGMHGKDKCKRVTKKNRFVM